MTTHPPKLLIIGWDGATFDVIRPMVDRGELPNIKGLMERGVHGQLRSTTPPSSAVAWPTFMTGRDPVGHGIFGFRLSDGHSYRARLASSRDIQAPSLWDWLGRSGLKVGVVNVPMTYPPRQVNGFLVAGMLTPGPEEVFTHPPWLGDKLLGKLPPYPIETRVMKGIQSTKSPLMIVNELRRLTTSFHSSTRDLLINQSWDSMTIVYRATDLVQHFLGFSWHPGLSAKHPSLFAESKGGIEAIYRQLDECLGDLLSLVTSDTTVIVLSDHGAGPTFGRFHINNWLCRQGFLVLKRGARYRGWMNTQGRISLKRIFNKTHLGFLARHLPRRLMGCSIPLPDRLQNSHLVDWHRTTVYVPPSGIEGAHLRLNLVGREPQGVIRTGTEAQELLKHLTRELSELCDAQGERLFDEISTTSDTTLQSTINNEPDLVASPSEKNFHTIAQRFTSDKRLFSEPEFRAAGQHRKHGILVISGPAIRQREELLGARLVDIAPTALHLMGLSVPSEMDGKVLLDALRSEWLSTHPVDISPQDLDTESGGSGKPYSPDEQTRVEESLRALGYLG